MFDRLRRRCEKHAPFVVADNDYKCLSQGLIAENPPPNDLLIRIKNFSELRAPAFTRLGI
jgi:hypothetical protein